MVAAIACCAFIGPAYAPGAPVDLTAAIAAKRNLDRQVACIATAIWHEARSESIKGQLAVAGVVMARTRQPDRFAPDPCSVVRQPHQFSFVHRGRIPGIPNADDARRMVDLASKVMNGSALTPYPKALFYHADYVSPGWNLQRIGQIGRHIFYVDPASPT